MDTHNPIISSQRQAHTPRPKPVKWAHVFGWICCILLIMYVTGCATIINEHEPAPAGWPNLTVAENSVSGPEIIRRCYKHLPLTQKLLGSFPMGCAEVRFDLNTCTIWYVYDATPEIIEHERQHCAGLSHVGDDWAARGLAAWRAGK